MSGSARKGWIVASSIGAVEALKDQLGVCRWNNVMRGLNQHSKINIRSYVNPQKVSSSLALSNYKAKPKRSKEECMDKVMDLNCWGPSTTRL
ncbi:wound-responsive family protein [Senna tora]|uniref:Wound-responsive family protein n=1 Tax=Senna tora TaxID=362788 RepID=A0A834X2F2_9FABA|nr:wound-responsive family protein [Senna tora]